MGTSVDSLRLDLWEYQDHRVKQLGLVLTDKMRVQMSHATCHIQPDAWKKLYTSPQAPHTHFLWLLSQSSTKSMASNNTNV